VGRGGGGGKGGRCLGLTTLSHSCDDLKSWESQTSAALGANLDLYRDSFTFTHIANKPY
jgi:hypothetical protein